MDIKSYYFEHRIEEVMPMLEEKQLYGTMSLIMDLRTVVDEEKEIRNKAIDEFTEKLLEKAPRNWAGELELGGATCYLSANKVKEIAKQMKGEKGNENSC